MIRINENYLKLQSSYLFLEIANRVSGYQKENPDAEVIRLGIGDVTLPLPPACIEAFKAGVKEMASDATFRGYGPENGYAFLRETIALNDYQSRGSDIQSEEIFVSDGAKCDTGNIQEIFAGDIRLAIPDPVYPVYLDTNVMAGRTGDFNHGRYDDILYLESLPENGFVPTLPEAPVDLIYLCFPNNPTGVTISKDTLKKWVDFARENKALILYDAAYEAFVRDPVLPRSIFEIEGARDVAIEFRSFSKTAGFTGTRCAYTVVPKSCMAYDSGGQKHSLHTLWKRRQSTKFNGVSYPVQKAAEATYSEQGKAQIIEMTGYYLKNAALIRKETAALGFEFVGGENSPYIWINCKRDAWEFFDLLLKSAGVVTTPGPGFGKCGEGFIRISAFNSYENVEKAMARIRDALGRPLV
ncbi:MAG: LL-diaminopimelate aminotransferase [Deltaproteobacteria bacterium]|jgi:LL-diaminopimelate aminotransferase|nr:LL-diaminopimelate aminotransferase [Deltaproteobacteria bacterium]MBW2571638.1 LL-diaminopimelate aminotransferase [Deltaproteobacteria bacterium]